MSGVRALSRGRFYTTLGVMAGEIDPERLDALRATLRGLTARELAGFHVALEREVERLDDAVLCYDDGVPAIGDGLRALQLAVVASGRDEVDRLVRARGPVVVLAPAEFALELAEVAFEICEEKGESWPLIYTGDFYDDAGGVVVLSVHILALPIPGDECSRRVSDLLSIWNSSKVYAEAVLANGMRAFRCYGAIYSKDAAWGPPGTRWHASQVSGVVEVNFTLDITELPTLDAAAGEQYVRHLVDRCARRWALPGADETLGPWVAP